jgi:hypothetical protein
MIRNQGIGFHVHLCVGPLVDWYAGQWMQIVRRPVGFKNKMHCYIERTLKFVFRCYQDGIFMKMILAESVHHATFWEEIYANEKYLI